MDAGEAIQRIGELMVERRFISTRQLEEALAQQRLTKEFLGAILVRMGFVTPENLLVALSERYHMPRESLSVERVDWTVVKQFPFSVVAEGKCFPIRADAESVTVAIANPLDAWALSAMERVAGIRRVKTVLVMEHELQAILRAYQQQVLRALGSRLNNEEHDGRGKTQ